MGRESNRILCHIDRAFNEWPPREPRPINFAHVTVGSLGSALMFNNWNTINPKIFLPAKMLNPTINCKASGYMFN